jgi:hypothetical protein
VWVEGYAVLDRFEEFTRRFRAVFDLVKFFSTYGRG